MNTGFDAGRSPSGVREGAQPRRESQSRCRYSGTGISTIFLERPGLRATLPLMRRWVPTALVVIWALSTSALSGQSTPTSMPSSVGETTARRALLDKYCVTCHNDRLKTANLSLQGLDLTHVADHAELWEKVIRKTARGRHAAAGHAAATARRVRRAARLARGGDRSRRGHADVARVGGAASVEPHRVRERHSRPARSADRRRDAAAAGRFGQRLRQHRRLADDLADAARVVRHGGGARRAHGGRLLEVADRSHLPGVERRLAEPAPRRHAVRHPRRHRRAPRLSGRRRVQVLDSELRHRQLHSRRAAGAHHRRRACARVAVSRRRRSPSA